MLLDQLIEAAKQNLVKDGELSPIFFLCRGEQFVMPPALMSMFDRICGHIPDMDEAKSRNVFLIGGMARKLNADRVIMIWDAAFRTVEPANAQSTMDDQTERPLLYPKTMRTECLIVEDIPLPSGEGHTDVIPYKGGEGVPVEFLPDTFPKDACYESRFPKLILQGYNKAGGL